MGSLGTVSYDRFLELVASFMCPCLKKIFNQPLPRQFARTLQFFNFLFQLRANADLDNFTFGHRTSPITSGRSAHQKHTDVYACLQGIIWYKPSSVWLFLLLYQNVSLASHRLQRSPLRVCPCQWCIRLVGAIENDVGCLAMERRETEIDPDPMKPHTTGNKDLGAAIRYVRRCKEMGNSFGLPPLSCQLPQMHRKTAAIRWQEITTNPSSQDRAIRAVYHVMQPQRSGDVAIDQAQQQLFRRVCDIETKISQRFWECVSVGNRQVIVLHCLPPDSHLLFTRDIGHSEGRNRQRCQDSRRHAYAPLVLYNTLGVCHASAELLHNTSPLGASGYVATVRYRRINRKVSSAQGRRVTGRRLWRSAAGSERSCPPLVLVWDVSGLATHSLRSTGAYPLELRLAGYIPSRDKPLQSYMHACMVSMPL